MSLGGSLHRARRSNLGKKSSEGCEPPRKIPLPAQPCLSLGLSLIPMHPTRDFCLGQPQQVSQSRRACSEQPGAAVALSSEPSLPPLFLLPSILFLPWFFSPAGSNSRSCSTCREQKAPFPIQPAVAVRNFLAGAACRSLPASGKWQCESGRKRGQNPSLGRPPLPQHLPHSNRDTRNSNFP